MSIDKENIKEDKGTDDPTNSEKDLNKDIANESPAFVKYTRKINEDAKWYVVHTYSGHEKKVAISLGERVKVLGLKDQINEVLIPSHKKVTISSGKKREINQRLFPGYILVRAVISDNVWQTIRNTPGVTGFVGIGSKPMPLPQAEVDSIVKYIQIDRPKFETKLREGDSVKITAGAFKDSLGKVNKIMAEQGRVEVLISVFDRDVPVEIDITQVQTV